MNYHYHKCSKCQTVWKHAPEPGWTESKRAKAHTCPTSGRPNQTNIHTIPTAQEKVTAVVNQGE